MIIGTILILLAGLLLIYFEFYLPGGIMGLTGGVLLFSNIIYVATKSDSMIHLFAIIAATIAGLIIIVKLALNRIKKAKPGDSIYHDDDQEGYCASAYDKDIIGKEGVAMSNLSPSGYVVIEDKKIQALSQVGFIKKGEKIIAIGGQGSHVIIKKKES